MENENLFNEIGLGSWEGKTYLALLSFGSTTTGPLVKRSGVPQSKIYAVLESLQNKGLASWIVKGKTKYFQASDPDKILYLFKEKERKVKSFVSELKSIQIKHEKKAVELFEGVKAMKGMLISLTGDVKKGENWFGFASGKTSANPEIEEFYEWWGSRKALLGLKDHLLISKENKEAFEKSLSKEAKEALKNKLKYSSVSFPGDVAIFRKHVIIFNWQDTPTAILITSKNLSDEYGSFYEKIWKSRGE